jgi:glycosyltransferase involved in cell wall biosynthesis
LLIIVGFSIQSFLLTKHCLKANIPYILYSGETINTAEVYEKNPARKILRSFIINNANGFFVYCEKAKEYIEGFKRKSDEIDVVINSIDTNNFISKLNGIEEVKNKVCKILFVGDLLKLKGIEYLLKAYSLLDDETKEISSLIIGGGGEDRDNLLKIIEQNKLKNVIITGKLKYIDTLKYFKDCDIFVLPSVRERFGLVLQEAACAGKPLIGSIYAGGSFELIEDNKNGFIIDPKNTEDFSSKLKILINNEKMRKEFGERSLEIVKEKVNIDIAAEAFCGSILKHLNVQAN